MREALKQARRVLLSSERLYRKLSRSQRTGILVVAGVVSLALILVAGGGSPGAPRDGASASASAWGSGSAMGSGSTGRGGSGSTASPATSSTAKVSGSAGAPVSSLLRLLPTPGAQEAERRQAAIARIEDNLPNTRVASASVFYEPPSPNRRVGDPRHESAAVRLVLREGVPALDLDEVAAIRELAASALGIRPAHVHVSDNLNHLYPADDPDGSPAVSGSAGGLLNRHVCDQIGKYYASYFSPEEFHVSAIVGYSVEDRQTEREEFDEGSAVPKVRKDSTRRVEEGQGPRVDGGFGVPARAESGRVTELTTETEEEFLTPSSKIRIVKPRGSVESVRVLVVLDQEAVLRVIEKRISSSRPELSELGLEALDIRAREGLVAEYREDQEKLLGSLLGGSFKDSRAWVDIQPFLARKRFSDAEPARTGPDPNVAAAARPPWLVPLGGILLGAALGAVAFVGGAGILRSLRRPGISGQAPEGPFFARAPGDRGSFQAPGLSGVGGVEIDGSGRWGVGEMLRKCGRRAGAPPRAGQPSDGLLRTVDDTSARVTRHPEVAAAVLRFWLSQDAEEPAEGASRP